MEELWHDVKETGVKPRFLVAAELQSKAGQAMRPLQREWP